MAKQNTELATKIGIKGAETVGAFKAYFLDVFIKRAYRQLDGPPSDLLGECNKSFLYPKR